MARIRSIHPGLFTDEDFVVLSDAAQILYVGLLTECDDQGAFEWKPIQIRIKLRPGKDGPVDALLEELVAVKRIMSYEHDGRKYGLVRNFQRYQRPKKPNSVHFIPEELRTFLGCREESSEPKPVKRPPVPHQFPTGGEKPPQMEDGGGRMDMEDVGESPKPPPKPTASRGTRIPDDFTPDEATLTSPDFDPLTERQRRAQIPRFCDHFRGKPGKDGVKVDWQATWRNWLRNEIKFHAKTGASHGNKPPRKNPIEDGLDFLDRLDKNRTGGSGDERFD